MWLFNFDSARFCSIEVVPVIIHQLCVSICFSLSCGQGVVTFFIFASLVGGKMFRRLCLLYIFLNMKAIILLICLRSIYIHFDMFEIYLYSFSGTCLIIYLASFFYCFILFFLISSWHELLLYFFLVCCSFFDFLVIFFLSRNISWWQFSFNSFKLLNHS